MQKGDDTGDNDDKVRRASPLLRTMCLGFFVGAQMVKIGVNAAVSTSYKILFNNKLAR